MLYNLFENRDFVSVFAVALREEGDRFGDRQAHAVQQDAVSPSARRATGLAFFSQFGNPAFEVALREEGDRFGLHVLDALPVSDFVALREEGDRFGRPPRGGRG